MATTYPRKGEQVDRRCVQCERSPEKGEVYGDGSDDWDFLGICPECWDVICEEEDPTWDGMDDEQPF